MRVKICGLTRPSDVEAAVRYGADAVGFVFEPSSKRYLSREAAKPLLDCVPPFVNRVAVFAALHADYPIEAIDTLQAITWPIESQGRRIGVVRESRDGKSLAEIRAFAQGYDAIHLDPFEVERFGGTGKLFDWEFAAEIVQAVGKPVILAGGLNPDNVAEAIARVKPFAVDVSTGVEVSPGIKDPLKIRDFIQAARG